MKRSSSRSARRGFGASGFAIDAPLEAPEHRLYALLARQHGDAAHSRYNALIRRLVSFERAAAAVRTRADA